jgi:hypothetical protein
MRSDLSIHQAVEKNDNCSPCLTDHGAVGIEYWMKIMWSDGKLAVE